MEGNWNGRSVLPDQHLFVGEKWAVAAGEDVIRLAGWMVRFAAPLSRSLSRKVSRNVSRIAVGLRF